MWSPTYTDRNRNQQTTCKLCHTYIPLERNYVSNNFIRPIIEDVQKQASVNLTKYILIWHNSKLFVF